MKCSSNKQLLRLGIKKIAYSSTTLEAVTEDYKFKVNSKMEDWSNELVGKKLKKILNNIQITDARNTVKLGMVAYTCTTNIQDAERDMA